MSVGFAGLAVQAIVALFVVDNRTDLTPFYVVAGLAGFCLGTSVLLGALMVLSDFSERERLVSRQCLVLILVGFLLVLASAFLGTPKPPAPTFQIKSASSTGGSGKAQGVVFLPTKPEHGGSGGFVVLPFFTTPVPVAAGVFASGELSITFKKEIKMEVGTGKRGRRGRRGPTGETGPSGPTGPTGDQGPPGTNGKNGKRGKKGKDGEILVVTVPYGS
jgi:hypothetical protein